MAQAAVGGPAATSWQVTFTKDGSTATFLTDLEARRAARRNGGGSIKAVTTT